METFATATPVHGISWAYQGGKLARRFWVSIMILAMAGLVYQSAQSAVRYHNKTPSTSYTVSSSENLEIPPVDICVPYRFHDQKLIHYGITREVAEVLPLAFHSSLLKKYATVPFTDTYGPNPLASTPEKFAIAEEKIRSILAQENITFAQLIDNLSFSHRDIVHRVSNGEMLIHDPPYLAASDDNLVNDVRTKLGYCTRFSAHTQTYDGTGSGRTYQLYADINNAGAGFRAPHKGLTMRLHTDLMDSDLVYLPFGTRVNVLLELTRENHVNFGSHGCQPRHPTNVSHATCVQQCLTEAKFDQCPCVPYDAEIPTEKPVCFPSELLKCLEHEVEVTNTEESLEEFNRRAAKCRKRCPIYCEVRHHEIQVTQMPFDLEYKRRDGKPVMDPSIVLLDTHYPTMMVIAVTHSPSVTIERLLGDVGGLLGFWMGGSAIALVQMCFFWTARVTQPGERRKEARKRKHRRRLGRSY